MSFRKYIKVRGLKGTHHEYSIFWDDELTKKFHITILLLRDLGLDLLTLENIPSYSFSLDIDIHSPEKFQRHHIFPNDKASINPDRLVLAQIETHTRLEGFTNLIIRLIEERIKWNDTCPNYYMNQLVDSDQNWLEFKRRRDIIKKKGIESFFREIYPNVVNRFYKDVPVGSLESAIIKVIKRNSHHAETINLFPEYLKRKLLL